MKTTKRRFNDKPSGVYLECLAALRVLAASEGTRGMERAFAEAAAPLREQEQRWWGKYEAERRGGPPKRMYWSYDRLLPGSDHTSIWRWPDGYVSYITQPYGLSSDELVALAELCQREKLKLYCSAEISWHFPSYTLAICVTGDAATMRRLCAGTPAWTRGVARAKP